MPEQPTVETSRPSGGTAAPESLCDFLAAVQDGSFSPTLTPTDPFGFIAVAQGMYDRSPVELRNDLTLMLASANGEAVDEARLREAEKALSSYSDSTCPNVERASSR